MIVGQFLAWMETAPTGLRAEATGALARAYLHGELEANEIRAAEMAMLYCLDDPAPIVRRALAEALGASEDAPYSIIAALASDQAEVAYPVLSRTPLLMESELVELVAMVEPRSQLAIAERPDLTPALCSAICSVADYEACVALVKNEGADIPVTSFDQLVKRFGTRAELRSLMLERPDLPVGTRHGLIIAVSQALFAYASGKSWMDQERAPRIENETCERATIALAANGQEQDMRPLVHYLRQQGRLNAQLLLRALLSRNVRFVEEAFSELSTMPVSRVAWIFAEPRSAAFKALYGKAGLPQSALVLFRTAFEAMEELGLPHDTAADVILCRAMVERVLTACEKALNADLEPFFGLLRRYYAEAARDEARANAKLLAAA